MKRLRDFGSIAVLLGEREIVGPQAAIDARRQAHAARGDAPRDGSPTEVVAAGQGAPECGGRAS